MRIPSRLVVAAVLLLCPAIPAMADKLDDELAASKALLLADNADAAKARLEGLVTLARQAIAAKADDAHAHYILGMASMYLGDDALALRTLDLATRLDPKSSVFAFGRAELASFQGKPVEAATILKRYLDQNPTNVEGWELLGTAQIESRQFDPARQSFQKAADLAPREPRYFARIAETYVLQGREDDAIPAYDKALAADPKYSIALMSLGDIHEMPRMVK